MSHLHSEPFSPPELAALHAGRLDRLWPHVQVKSAHVTPDIAGQCARAVVQLGGLTPADVRVELMPAGATGGSVATPSDERRMFSCQALGNGCFVFETALPHRDVARVHEWLIHVHPSEGLDEPRVEFRFSE